MWRQLLWGGYFIALFVATHVPVPAPIVEVFNYFDKAIHAVAFCTLAILTAEVFLKQRAAAWQWGLLIAVLMAYAALDEFLQGFVNRTPDVYDWIADSIGIVIGCLISMTFRRWRSLAPGQSDQVLQEVAS